MPINIIIADAQFLVTETLKVLLSENTNYNLLGIAENTDELDELLSKNTVNVLITDFCKFDYDGIDSIKKIQQKYNHLSIMVLTNHVCKTNFLELRKTGINTIVLKTVDRNEFFSSLEATIKKKKYYSGEVLDLLTELSTDKNNLNENCTLTATEIDIVRSISNGLSTKQIALQKHISFHTVNTHRKNIFRKLAVNNVSELIMVALKNGLIDNIDYYI